MCGVGASATVGVSVGAVSDGRTNGRGGRGWGRLAVDGVDVPELAQSTSSSSSQHRLRLGVGIVGSVRCAVCSIRRPVDGSRRT